MKALQTRMVGYTTHRSGHVMAPMDIVYECEEEPKPMPLVPFLGGLAVRLIFGLSPFLLAIMLMARAGWLPS